MAFFKNNNSSSERPAQRWSAVPDEELPEYKSEATRESSEEDLEMLWPKTGAVSSKLLSSSTPRFKIDPRIISDAIIGLSDGLTVPFALTAGLSTLGTRTVIFAGMAELIAGAISMGLGGYLGAVSEKCVPLLLPPPPSH